MGNRNDSTATARLDLGWVARIAVAGVLAIMTTAFYAAPAHADRAFDDRFVANQPGDITIIGNTNLTCTPGSNSTTAPVVSCANAQAGAVKNNNDFNPMFEVDVDSDPATDNSSRATLAMPSNGSVLWAGLYWFANSAAAGRENVKFQAPGQSGYSTLTSNTTGPGTIDTSGAFYQGHANVTAAVRAAGNGAYTVADVTRDATLADNDNAGWALVVVYADATQPPRNLSVFDGLVQVSQGANATRTITVNGFTTPPSGAVNSTLGVVSQDGDLASTGDSLSLENQPVFNTTNPQSNVFNSTITTLGTDEGGRTPNYKNQLGMDIDLFDVDGYLGNLDTSASIKLTTGGETYLPGVVTLATELYAPVVVPSKSVVNLTHPGNSAQPGDTLRYTLNFENTGQDAADGFVVTDPIPAGATYKPGTLSIGGSGGMSDGPGDDQAEFVGAQNSVVFRLGTGANATTGGSIAAGGGTASATFDVTVDAGHQEGDTIVNRASSDYRGHTVGTPFIDQLTPQVTTPIHVPDLTLAKTHTPAFVAGGTTTFTLVSSNIGTAPTDGSTVTITDTFPGGAAGFDSITNAEGAGWNCSIAGLTLTCTRTDALSAGQSYPPIFVDAVVHDPIAATIVNTATVSGGGDANPNNNTGTDSGGATSQADIQVTKRTTTPALATGDTIEWIVDVHNAGPSTAANVTLDDPLSGADYDQIVAVPTQGTCDTSVNCTLGSIVPGGTASITIHARVLGNDETLTNTATGDTTTADPDPTNDSGDATAVIGNTADVSIVKTGAPANPNINTVYTYTLAMANAGPGTATDLVVTDQLPDALGAPIVVNAAGWTCNAPAPAGVLTCTRPSQAVGAAPPITISGTVLPAAGGNFFSNSAAIDTSSQDPDKGNNTSTTTELATPGADLQVTKTFDSDAGTPGVQSGPVLPGASVAILLPVTNNGPSTADDVTLQDVVPAGLTVTGVSAGCTEAPPNTVNCTLGDINNGDSVTVTITATVDAPPVNGQTMSNTVTVASTTTDPIPGNNEDTALLTVVPAADVSLSKSADDNSPAVGDTVTYQLVALNAGPSTAGGVTVSDPIPAGLTYVAGSASAGCTFAANTITCVPAGPPVGEIPAMDFATFSFQVTVDAASAGQAVGNTAEVTTTTPHDPDPTNNRSTTTIDVQPRADLQMTKTAASATPAVDADNTYTLTVQNHGPNAAENVTIDDPLPAGATFVSASLGCQLNGANIHCDLGTIPAGDSVSRDITLRFGPALAGQPVINTATAGSSTDDPNPGNNTDDANVTVGKRVDLKLRKTVTPASATPGGTAAYTLEITNAGPSPATGVTLTDTLPPGLDLISAVPTQGTCALAVNNINCDLGTIASGSGAQVLVTVRPQSVAAGQQLNNTANVTSNEPEARTGDNTSGTALAVGPNPPADPGRVTIRKKASKGTISAGQKVTFTLTVTSLGPDPAVNVTVCDRLPAGLLFVSAPGGKFKSGQVCWKFAQLAAGAVRKLKLVARAASTPTNRRIVNTATAKSKGHPKARGSAAVRVRGAAGRPGGVTG